MSSAFTGSFSSTVPPGKSTMNFLLFFTALARASITSLRRKSDSWHAHQVYNFKRNAFQVSTFMITFVVSFSIGTFFWFSSVQLLRCVQLFATPWSAARQASLSITNSQTLLKLTSIRSVIPSSHICVYYVNVMLIYSYTKYMINMGGMANIIYKIDVHKFYICVYTHTLLLLSH